MTYITSTLRKIGHGTLIITIPKITIKKHNLSEGDIIDLKLEEITKKPKTDKKLTQINQEIENLKESLKNTENQYSFK